VSEKTLRTVQQEEVSVSRRSSEHDERCSAPLSTDASHRGVKRLIAGKER
jgi:hypothetical protein